MASKKGRGRGESQNSPRRLEAHRKQLEVLRLANAGWTYDRIAAEVGYSNASGVFVALKAALKKSCVTPSKTRREVQGSRIQTLIERLWKYTEPRTRIIKQKQEDGSIAEVEVEVPPSTDAIDRVIKLLAREADLYNLDLKQTRTQLTGDPANPVAVSSKQELDLSKLSPEILRGVLAALESPDAPPNPQP